jgi:hypothetical protein
MIGKTAVGKCRRSSTVVTTTITYSVAAAIDTTASAGNTHCFLKHEEI